MDFLDLARSALKCDSLEVQTHAAWAGKRGQSSKDPIRNFLRSKIAEKGLFESPPLISQYSLSISHSDLAGGFALVSRPFKVGFDIEARTRITQDLISRVCSETEIKEALEITDLWGAKEAVFKSLWPQSDVSVLSNIKIHSWQQGYKEFRTFQASLIDQKINGYGCVMSRNEIQQSVFVIHP